MAGLLFSDLGAVGIRKKLVFCGGSCKLHLMGMIYMQQKHTYIKHPGQTFALVLVTASTRISFFLFFFSHSAALPLFHPKDVEAGTQRKDFFLKAG